MYLVLECFESMHLISIFGDCEDLINKFVALKLFVMFLKLWLKVVHIDQRQNMNWPLADNFEAKNVTFLPIKLASNVQSSCIDNSKWPKSELWLYCSKATLCIIDWCIAWRFNESIYYWLWFRQETGDTECRAKLCMAILQDWVPHRQDFQISQ